MDFQQFYSNTYQLVYLYFYHRVDDKTAVKDLTHDVYLEYYQKYTISDYTDQKYVRLLIGFCRIKLKSYYRESAKEYKISLDHIENYVTYGEEKETSNSNSAKYELIKSILPKLKGRVRMVIEYRYLHGLTRAQTAALLHMKERDVLKYQQRGITYLKKRLQEKLEIPKSN